MKKFTQILALVFALAFGYGLGQHAQDLFATDYPGGGAGGGTHPVNLASDVTGELPHGSTSDDASNVHGLPASVNVLGNRNASGEFIQRDSGAFTTGTSDQAMYPITANITFPVAFSATPIIIPGSNYTGNSVSTMMTATLATTTTCDITGFGNVQSTATRWAYIALGT